MKSHFFITTVPTLACVHLISSDVCVFVFVSCILPHNIPFLSCKSAQTRKHKKCNMPYNLHYIAERVYFLRQIFPCCVSYHSYMSYIYLMIMTCLFAIHNRQNAKYALIIIFGPSLLHLYKLSLFEFFPNIFDLHH